MKDLYDRDLVVGKLYLFIWKDTYGIYQLLEVDSVKNIYHVKELGWLGRYNREIGINQIKDSKGKLYRNKACVRAMSKYALLEIEEFFCDKIKEKINEAISKGT